MDLSKNEEFLKLLRQTFVAELTERIQAINQDLLSLEQTDDSEKRVNAVVGLQHSLHGLKGAARAGNCLLIEDASHQFETVLEPYEENPDTMPPEYYSLFFKTTDGITDAADKFLNEEPLENCLLASVVPVLKLIGSGESEPETIAEKIASLPQLVRPQTAEAVTESESAESEIAETETKQPELPLHQQISPTKAELQAMGGKSKESKPPPAPSTVPRKTTTSTVRVPAEKLDSLLAQTGELVVARIRLESRTESLRELQRAISSWKKRFRGLRSDVEREQNEEKLLQLQAELLQQLPNSLNTMDNLHYQIEELVENMTGDCRLLRQVSTSIEEEVHRVRLFPFAQACVGLDRTVRDIAQETGKQVQLLIDGGDVQVDRSVLEAVKDPLLHLVRNAVDHGIETPAEREAAGKERLATVRVSAKLSGSRVEISVQDDGKGFQLESIQRRAEQRELPIPQEEADIARLVFLPGFSTASKVTNISGRGVGLDVVKTHVEQLHGTVDVLYQPGQGATFLLKLPLTLTTMRSVLIRVAGQLYAVPTVHVERFLHIRNDQIQMMNGQSVIFSQKQPVPMISLSNIFGMPEEPLPISEFHKVAILVSGEHRVAFLLDDILAEEDIVVKSLGSRLRRVWFVSGATLQPSGEIGLVLQVPNLIRTALKQPRHLQVGNTADPQTPAKVHRLLVVDDSVTTRTLMKNILERAGYEVISAIDGEDALDQLQYADVELVVSDIDMPRKDGFELTETIRNSERFASLPVILVTARDKEEDNARGLEVGADAYIVKGAFDQTELLETIAQHL